MIHPTQKTSWSSKQSQEEKYDMLHIDVTGGLTIMFESGEIDAHGSFDYLKEESVSVS